MNECAGRKSMSEVVQTRAMTVRWAAQADLPRQHIESSMNVSAVQLIAPAGDKQVGRHWPLPPMTVASVDIICEDFTGRGMQGHQAIFTEFGTADGQHRCLEIDVSYLEVACFAEAQARHTQKPEQTVVDPRAQLTAFIAVWKVKSCAQ